MSSKHHGCRELQQQTRQLARAAYPLRRIRCYQHLVVSLAVFAATLFASASASTSTSGTSLTSQQCNQSTTTLMIDTYHTNGFVHYERLFPENTMKAMTQLVRAAHDSDLGVAADNAEEKKGTLGIDLSDREFQMATNLMPLDSFRSQQAKWTIELLPIAAALMGVPVNDCCLWFDRTFFKERGDAETHWHRDKYSTDPRAPPLALSSITAWVPLHTLNGNNTGRLQYITGSHLVPVPIDYTRVPMGTALDAGEACPMVMAEEEEKGTTTSVDTKVGDVLFHDGRLCHSSEKNTNGLRRREAYAAVFVAGKRAVSESDISCRDAPLW